ncbi:MAG: hypothetical protein Q7S74_04955 [Nanoarchaeota archaeon]|nr:hypothetical protein [Nanoarchaeota archaeon]
MITKKICPTCGSFDLMPVAGGLTGIWMCKECGYSGNMIEKPIIGGNIQGEDDMEEMEDFDEENIENLERTQKSSYPKLPIKKKVVNKKSIKRFPKPSLSPQQADGVFRSVSRRKSLIAKSDDAAELRGIKPNLAIKKKQVKGKRKK